FFLIVQHPTRSTLFPYTTLFRSEIVLRQRFEPEQEIRLEAADGIRRGVRGCNGRDDRELATRTAPTQVAERGERGVVGPLQVVRSEEHTSELQSPYDLVCRLLLE